MVEHVRRRAILFGVFSDVYVATCDQEIANVVESFGGKVLMTGTHHINGTSRAAEAVKQLHCSHVVLLQGDEPLILKRHLEQLISRMLHYPQIEAWNLTSPIIEKSDLDRHSFVKCSVSSDQNILYCFRRSPSVAHYNAKVKFIRKMLGVISFRKDILIKLSSLEPTLIETSESIEQMRIIENNFHLKSVAVNESLPAVNEPEEVHEVARYMNDFEEQKDILIKISREL